MMATRFMATQECQIHQNIKQTLVSAQENNTQLIGKTLHLQCRGLKNELLEKIVKIEESGGGYKEMLPLMSGKWAKDAYKTGDVEKGLFTVGQTIGLIEDIPTMRDLMSGMVVDAKKQLDRVRLSLGN
ncbi:MAG: hypothetical protein DRQ47_09235 [Gammaproteobacteria bacterium]|nr:MAG: hypothetical protein DRQ47_09235 [Gammaproteobacteria bacterium]